jgi:NAD-reducing hydrogenase large subunit
MTAMPTAGSATGAGREILIDPVTRIEGHAKITIQLHADGSVDDAHFHVTQVRGFEKFCEGRPFTEMPSLMARICGICPVSHLIASAKACDALLTVQIPEAAVMLRRVLNLAQITQSHALSFFHLSSPDLLLGMDAEPAKRNIFGVLAAEPNIGRDGVRLRQIGQYMIELLAGKRIHPGWVVPGGVNAPLTAEARDEMLPMLAEARQIVIRTLAWYKTILGRYSEEIATFANFPSLFMALSNEDGTLEHYDGLITVAGTDPHFAPRSFTAARYAEFITEQPENWTYLKSPYYAPLGKLEGMYRVGPLARLLVARQAGTPLANMERSEFLARQRDARTSSFHYHYARLIEILFAVERADQLLREPEILNPRVRARAEPNALEGIGVSEAPRGTLIHHYRIDQNGLIQSANLIIATGHNNLAMNRGVLDVARHYIRDGQVTEGMLNRVEAVIRAFDPCLSCSTHAIGQMPLSIEIRGATGQLLDHIVRG